MHSTGKPEQNDHDHDDDNNHDDDRAPDDTGNEAERKNMSSIRANRKWGQKWGQA